MCLHQVALHRSLKKFFCCSFRQDTIVPTPPPLQVHYLFHSPFCVTSKQSYSTPNNLYEVRRFFYFVNPKVDSVSMLRCPLRCVSVCLSMGPLSLHYWFLLSHSFTLCLFFPSPSLPRNPTASLYPGIARIPIRIVQT